MRKGHALLCILVALVVGLFMTDLIANRDFNRLEIVRVGTIQFTYSFSSHAATSGGGEVSTTYIPINLDFVPILQIYWSDPTGVSFTELVSGGVYDAGFSSGINYIRTFSVHVDQDYAQVNLLQDFSVTSGTLQAISETLPLKYYIFRETSN